MKENIYALYNGTEYEAGIANDQEVVLRSDDPAVLNQGFILYKGIKYIKKVRRTELTDLYKKYYQAKYKNYPFVVTGDSDDKVLIIATNIDYKICEQLGMEMVDRGVYQKWVQKNEVELSITRKPI
ncbi:hypothetical protein [Paenibacillus sp. HW567]|uniref:hypothetical protein n=1 Tax=Paenibacillus sp. HW567 TaxID=1034769 RepID=UPI00037653DE|nr:hypothetical protein [Paenibacillus sp. HW567]